MDVGRNFRWQCNSVIRVREKASVREVGSAGIQAQQPNGPPLPTSSQARNAERSGPALGGAIVHTGRKHCTDCKSSSASTRCTPSMPNTPSMSYTLSSYCILCTPCRLSMPSSSSRTSIQCTHRKRLLSRRQNEAVLELDWCLLAPSPRVCNDRRPTPL